MRRTTVWGSKNDQNGILSGALVLAAVIWAVPAAAEVPEAAGEAPPYREGSTERAPRRRVEHLFFELGAGVLVGRFDDYEQRLEDFDYHSISLTRSRFHYAFGAYCAVLRYLQLGLIVSRLDHGDYETEWGAAIEKRFEWTAYRAGAEIRGSLPVANDWLVLYVQAGGGIGWARTELSKKLVATGETPRDEQRFVKWWVGGGGGLQLNFMRYMGVFWQGEFAYAPIIDNLAGDTHNSGGVIAVTGIRAGF